MFCYCNLLSSLPDISKWNTSNLEYNNSMFDGCQKLLNEPKIEIKKKGIYGMLFG